MTVKKEAPSKKEPTSTLTAGQAEMANFKATLAETLAILKKFSKTPEGTNTAGIVTDIYIKLEVQLTRVNMLFN